MMGLGALETNHRMARADRLMNSRDKDEETAGMASIDDLRIEGVSPPPKTRRRFALPIAAAVFASLSVVAWILNSRLNPAVSTEVESYLVPADAGQTIERFSAGGYLEVIPPGPTVVSSIVEGRVAAIHVTEGDAVEAGQELLRLDDTQHRQEFTVRTAAVELAEARLTRLEAGFRPEEIEQARAALDGTQARLTRARAQHERHRKLIETGGISQADFDASLAEWKAAESELAARRNELELREKGTRPEDIAIAKAELEAAQAELERARQKLDACMIKAPIGGIVLERFAQVGDWLSLSSPGERRGALLSIVDPKRVQAWVDVNQRDIGRVSIGQPVELVTDANPAQAVPGRVARVLPKANLQKNTVQVKIEIPDPPNDLRPEMSVKVTFVSNRRPESSTRSQLFLPTTALVRRDGSVGVFVLLNGKAVLRSVELTEESAERVAIVSGIAPGDRIILNPQGLADGQPVQARKQ